MEINFERAYRPFKDMKVGQIISIGLDYKLRAYAHVYGHQSGRKFQTKTVGDKIYIKRTH